MPLIWLLMRIKTNLLIGGAASLWFRVIKFVKCTGSSPWFISLCCTPVPALISCHSPAEIPPWFAMLSLWVMVAFEYTGQDFHIVMGCCPKPWWPAITSSWWHVRTHAHIFRVIPTAKKEKLCLDSSQPILTWPRSWLRWMKASILNSNFIFNLWVNFSVLYLSYKMVAFKCCVSILKWLNTTLQT